MSSRQRLLKLPRKTCPFVNLPNSNTGRSGAEDLSSIAWVKPSLVAQVAFTEWPMVARAGTRFLGLCPDKRAAERPRTLKDPDHRGILPAQCPPNVQDAFAEALRRRIGSNSEFVVAGIKQIRRVAADPAAPAAERTSARLFLKRHGLDDESLAGDE